MSMQSTRQISVWTETTREDFRLRAMATLMSKKLRPAVTAAHKGRLGQVGNVTVHLMKWFHRPEFRWGTNAEFSTHQIEVQPGLTFGEQWSLDKTVIQQLLVTVCRALESLASECTNAKFADHRKSPTPPKPADSKDRNHAQEDAEVKSASTTRPIPTNLPTAPAAQEVATPPAECSAASMTSPGSRKEKESLVPTSTLATTDE